MLKSKFLFFSILLAGYSVLHAEMKDSVQLSELLVTGSKTTVSRKVIPLSVSQISSVDIENSGHHNVLPTLNTYIPGIFVTERGILGFGVGKGGSGAISVRGISSAPNSGILVLIDGHPQYQGIFGHPLPDAYVASDVQKVEVIRGPASILYGSNAMAGVINLITKKQTDKGFKINASASYGSYNTQKYNGSLGFKHKKLNAYISVNHDRTDGTRPHTDFKITNGYSKVGYEINKHFNINTDFSIAKINANDNGPITAPPALFNIDIVRGKASLSIDNIFEKADGSLKVYHNFGEHTLSDGFHSTDRNSGIMLYETLKLFKNNSFTIGTDWKQYGGIVNVPPTVANKLLTIDELAFYGYSQQKFFEKLTLSVGLRYENNSVYGSELVPMGGLSYVLNQNTSFKSSVSKGFRSPTIMELYMYMPNPDLKPERMINYELGWLQSIMNNKINWELTAFWVKGSDLIQVAGVPPALKRQNIGTFDNKGIEFSINYLVTEKLMLHGNYSYVAMEKKVLASPRQQTNLSANYRHKIWNFNLSAQYIDQLYTQLQTQSLTEVTQSFVLLNARISVKPLKYLDVFVMANNLLNQSYEINFGYPMPATYFSSGFNVKL